MAASSVSTLTRPMFILVVCSFGLAGVANAQSHELRLAQIVPDVAGPIVQPPERMLIGPVPGLTIGWHTAPQSAYLCSNITVQFFQPAPNYAAVTWIGAEEISRDDDGSTAECPIHQLGQISVQSVVTINGQTFSHESRFEIVDTPIEDIVVTPIVVEAHPLDLLDTGESIFDGMTQDEINELTVHIYMRRPSIAGLRNIGVDHYRTSILRELAFSIDVDPAGFAPLMEWRFNGAAMLLGTDQLQKISTIGNHVIDVGPVDNPSSVQIDTFRTLITSHKKGRDHIKSGVPTTFEAVTDPPGYEEDIIWLASTKYGYTDVILGYGPSFTVQFDDTWGENRHGQLDHWLGARSDNAGFGEDIECDDDEDCEDCQSCNDNGYCEDDCDSCEACVNDQCEPACGACCDGNGCSIQNYLDCQGAFGGIGSECSEISGACCDGLDCFQTNKSCCTEGEFFANQECGDVGACCGAGDCTMATKLCCESYGFTFVGGDCESGACQGACCDDEQCTITSDIDCDSFQGYGTSCEPDPCNPVTGACCDNPDCEEVPREECTGSYQGDDSTCGPAGACCEVAFGGCYESTEGCCEGYAFEEGGSCGNIGACCIAEDCFETSQFCCESYGGLFGGSGSVCDVQGACCLDGQCEVMTRECCENNGGTFHAEQDCEPDPCAKGACCDNEQCSDDVRKQECSEIGYLGNGSQCGPIGSCCDNDSDLGCYETSKDCCGDGNTFIEGGTCGEPGACCANGDCFMSTPECCEAQNGYFGGEYTICDEVEGACCFANGECEILRENCCTNNGGTFHPGESCSEIGCKGSCCRVDGDCDENLPSEQCNGTFERFNRGQSCGQQGACCLVAFDGCVDTTENCCDGFDFFPGANCDATGACCFGDDCYDDMTEFCCVGYGGWYGGDGSTCDPGDNGACCFDNGECETMRKSCCEHSGGFFEGSDSCEDANCCRIKITDGCDGVDQFLKIGDSHTFTAEGKPNDGVYRWRVIQPGSQVTPTSGEGKTFTITAANGSLDKDDVIIKVTYTPPDKEPCEAECTLTVIDADIDIDSDNNNGSGPPDRSATEDGLEAIAPGKYIGVDERVLEDHRNRAPLVVELKPNLSTGRWRLSYPTNISVFLGESVVPSGLVWNGPLSPNPLVLAVEAKDASASLGDTAIVLEYDADGDGAFDVSDTVVATIVEAALDISRLSGIVVDQEVEHAPGSICRIYVEGYHDSPDASRLTLPRLIINPEVAADDLEVALKIAGPAARVQGRIRVLKDGQAYMAPGELEKVITREMFSSSWQVEGHSSGVVDLILTAAINGNEVCRDRIRSNNLPVEPANGTILGVNAQNELDLTDYEYEAYDRIADALSPTFVNGNVAICRGNYSEHTLEVPSTMLIVGMAGAFVKQQGSDVYAFDYEDLPIANGVHSGPVFVLSGTVLPTTEIAALNILHGRSQHGGGVRIRNSEHVKLRLNEIQNNKAEDGPAYGGGLFIADSAEITIESNRIHNNSVEAERVGEEYDLSAGGGGGLYIQDSRVVQVVDNHIFENRADSYGGGIACRGTVDNTGPVLIRGLDQNRRQLIQDNEARVGGGVAICGLGDNFYDIIAIRGFEVLDARKKGIPCTVENNLFVDNRARRASVESRGGGLYNGADNSVLSLSHNEFSNNMSSGDGGAVVAFNFSHVDASHNLIQHNRAGDNGGGVSHSTLATADWRHNTITQNTARAEGGGLHATLNAIVDITGNQFTNNRVDPSSTENRAVRGAAVYIRNSALISHGDNLFDSNHFIGPIPEGAHGGAIAIRTEFPAPVPFPAIAKLRLVSGDRVTNNSAFNQGGAIIVEDTTALFDASVRISGVFFSNNSAGSGHGGFNTSGIYIVNTESHEGYQDYRIQDCTFQNHGTGAAITLRMPDPKSVSPAIIRGNFFQMNRCGVNLLGYSAIVRNNDFHTSALCHVNLLDLRRSSPFLTTQVNSNDFHSILSTPTPYGILIDHSDYGNALRITRNNFMGHNQTNAGWATYVRNPSKDIFGNYKMVKAPDNYWNHPSGPHDLAAPAGWCDDGKCNNNPAGDRVSNAIDYENFSTSQN